MPKLMPRVSSIAFPPALNKPKLMLKELLVSFKVTSMEISSKQLVILKPPLVKLTDKLLET